MQPGNIRDTGSRDSYIARLYAYFLRNEPCWGRARPSNCRGAFFLLARGFVPLAKEGTRSGDEVPEAAARKLDRGTASAVVPLSPKRLHRRREPSPALFQHFAALFYLTRVRLSCDWIIQIPFSILSSARCNPRSPSPLLPPPFLSRPHRLSIRRFSPPDNFPSRFLLRCYCLYWSHIRVKGLVIVPGLTTIPTNAIYATFRMLPFRMGAFERKPL